MIYTLTVNPSLDYILNVKDLRLEALNRSSEEKIFAGGKGINVSIVLSRLGIQNTALGFLAGFTGTEIESQMASMGVNTDFVYLHDGNSRINIKLLSNSETEINGCGPFISMTDLDRLDERLEKISCGDILILSGSVPAFVSDSFYADIMERLGKKGVEFVVDATGPLLRKSILHSPFLIKPNEKEMQEFFDLRFMYEDSYELYGKKLLELGARNVLLSLGGKGAILFCEDGRILRQSIPQGKVVYSVGAGDSMLAGFMAEYTRSRDFEKALRFSVATGSASAYSMGLAEKDTVERLLEKLPPVDVCSR